MYGKINVNNKKVRDKMMSDTNNNNLETPLAPVAPAAPVTPVAPVPAVNQVPVGPAVAQVPVANVQAVNQIPVAPAPVVKLYNNQLFKHNLELYNKYL